MRGNERNEARTISLVIIAFGVVVAGLVYGSSLLMPLATAIFFWSVMEALIKGFAGLSLAGVSPPRWLATILGLATLAGGLYLISTVLLGQVDAISAAWPRYVGRFESIVGNVTDWLGPERSAKVRETLADIDLTRRIPGLLSSTSSIVLGALLVLAYVAFLFVERGEAAAKLAAMLPDKTKSEDAAKLFTTISTTVQRYIWYKTLVSVLTGVACYVVLYLLHIDFAETWALLIFVLNYIPNIGSIIGVAFPALIALVQFESLSPFLVLVASLIAIQVLIGSVLEPILMGKGLNMSPLAIILSLAFWGTIWGIIGMFLSVPILVVVMVVCAHLPNWRWVAVLLSKDGRIPA